MTGRWVVGCSIKDLVMMSLRDMGSIWKGWLFGFFLLTWWPIYSIYFNTDDDTWFVCDIGPWICRACEAADGYRKNLTFSDVYKFIWRFSFLSTTFLFYISVPRDIDYRVEVILPVLASDSLAQCPLQYRWSVKLYGRSHRNLSSFCSMLIFQEPGNTQ